MSATTTSQDTTQVDGEAQRSQASKTLDQPVSSAPTYPPPMAAPMASPAANGAYSYAPPIAPRTNGFAIASFVLSLIGGSMFAVIFGHIAISQINRSSGLETGKGFAIAGLVIGYITLAVVLGFLVALLLVAATSSTSGAVLLGIVPG